MPAGERGNNWFIIELTSDFVDPNTVEPFPEPKPVVDPTQGGGGGRPFMHGAGAPAFEESETQFEATASLLRANVQVFAGVIDLQRSNPSLFSATIDLRRKSTINLSVEREPAHHYLQVLKEDEELLVML